MVPKQDGRNMVMVLGPDKKAQAEYRKKLESGELDEDDEQTGTV